MGYSVRGRGLLPRWHGRALPVDNIRYRPFGDKRHLPRRVAQPPTRFSAGSLLPAGGEPRPRRRCRRRSRRERRSRCRRMERSIRASDHCPALPDGMSRATKTAGACPRGWRPVLVGAWSSPVSRSRKLALDREVLQTPQVRYRFLQQRDRVSGRHRPAR